VHKRKATVISSIKAIEMKEEFINSKRSRKLTNIYSLEESDPSSSPNSPKKELSTKDLTS